MGPEIVIDHPETLETHPLSEVWLPLPTDQLRELAGDVRRRGLLEPIVLLDGRVLDGRSRLKACRLAEVVPRFVGYAGTDPLGDVTSAHLYQRAPGNAARALAAARLVRLSGGTPASGPKRTVVAAAREVGVGVGAVKVAAEVLTWAADELVALMASGKVTPDAARLVARDLPAAEQAALVHRGGAKAVRARAADLRKAEKAAKRRVEEAHGPSPFTPAPPAAPLPPRIAKIASLVRRVTAELTSLLHQPEGERFADYIGVLKLGWVNHAAKCVVAGEDGQQILKTARFIGLIPLSRLLVAAARDKRYGAKKLAELVLEDEGENALDAHDVLADEPELLVVPETL